MDNLGKILAVLDVNGEFHHQECPNIEKAAEQTGKWLERAKQSFPNGNFTPKYYPVLGEIKLGEKG